jgi:hypothetical protein
MSILNLLLSGASSLGWNGGQVPPGTQPNILPNPPGSRHETYSMDGQPVIQVVAAGFVPPLPQPSQLEEADPSNTAQYRNAPGQRYLDNLPG